MARPRIAITKRRCIIIVLMLLAWGAGGAIVNVAVAWACAARSPTGAERLGFDRIDTHADSFWIAFGESRGFGFTILRVRGFHEIAPESRQHLPSWGRIREQKTAMEVFKAGGIWRSSELAAGWPSLALMAGERVDRSLDCGIRVPSPLSSGAGRILPTCPIWPGFAINTVFYAAVLWMLFAVPLALRKRRRIKRGWCPKCAYDLRGRAPSSTVCPECGLTVKPTT